MIGVLAWAAAGLGAAGYAVYVLAKLPGWIDDPVLPAVHCAGLAASVYAAGTAGFGLLHLREEIAVRLGALARTLRFWRLLAYLATGALVAGLAAGDDPDVCRAVFRTGLASGTLAVLLAISFAGRLAPLARSRWLRRADLALFNILVTAFLLEGALRVFAATSDSPLFMRYESDNKIERALRPGQVRMGFHNNARGYYDSEFSTEKPEGTFRVVALGDSFAAGIVPYPYNALTVLEERLQATAKPEGVERFEIYNMGVNGIDAGDYRYLLLTEGLAYQPDLVLVLFYLGNDFRGTALPGILDRNWWFLYFVPHRLLTIGREARRRGVDVVEVGEEKESDWQDPAYLDDPALEEPSFSAETYMEEIEGKWLKNFRRNGAARRREGLTMGALADIFRTARSRPGGKAALVIVPAEFQVDDQHYREVLDYLNLRAEDFDLAEPAERLSAFCRDEGVPSLDLTGPLREAHRSGHVYHLRDMHWNKRGNLAAAEAMAPFVLEAVRGGP